MKHIGLLTRRSICTALCIALLLSVFSIVPVGVSAADNVIFSDFGDNTTKDEAVFKNIGESLCSGGTTAYKNVKTGGKWTRTSFANTKGGGYQNLTFLHDNTIEPKKYAISDGASPWYTDNHFMGSGCKMAIDKYGNSEGSPTEADPERGIAKKYYNDGSELFVDIEQDFGRIANVKNIIIAHGSTKELRTGHYFLYVSETLNDLYDSKNLVYEYNDDTAYRVHNYSFNTAVRARYMAIRIYNPYYTADTAKLLANNTTKMSTNCYVRLFEFNAYGEERSYQVNRYPYSKIAYNKTKQRYSLIAGKLPSEAYSCLNNDIKTKQNLGVFKAFCESDPATDITETAPFASLTDDNPDTMNIIKGANAQHSFLKSGDKSISYDESKLYHQLVYQLDDEANITGFNFYGAQDPRVAPYIFRFSIADNKSELFGSKAYNSDNIYNFSRATEVLLTTAKKGSWFALRIICPAQPDYTSAGGRERLGELQVFGKYISSISAATVNNIIKTKNGTVITVSDASTAYSGTRDINGAYSSAADIKLTAKPSLKRSGDKYYFVGWSKNQKGELLETTELTYTSKANTGVFYAVYDYNLPTVKVKYTFLDKAGNTACTVSVPRGTSLTAEQYESINAAVPQVTGYKRKTAFVRFGSQQKEMPLWNGELYGEPADIDRTFSPIFEATDERYTITVNGKAKGDGGCRFDERITATSSGAAGWTMNGIAWSSTSMLDTYVVGDMEFKSATAANGISLYDTSGKSCAAINGDRMAFFAKQHLPSGAAVSARGLLVMNGDYRQSSDFTSKKYEKLTLGNAQMQIASSTSDGEHFAITLTGVERKQVRVARAYVTYTLSGKQTTVYSNVVVLQMNG